MMLHINTGAFRAVLDASPLTFALRMLDGEIIDYADFCNELDSTREKLAAAEARAERLKEVIGELCQTGQLAINHITSRSPGFDAPAGDPIWDNTYSAQRTCDLLEAAIQAAKEGK